MMTHILAFDSPVCVAVGTVVFAPMLGGPKAATAPRMRLMHFATLTGVLLAAMWMIAQYCLQVRPVCECVRSQLVCNNLVPAVNIGASIASQALLPQPRKRLTGFAKTNHVLLGRCTILHRRV